MCAIARLTFTSLHRCTVAFPSPLCRLSVLIRFASATSMWHNLLLVLPALLLFAGLGWFVPGCGLKVGNRSLMDGTPVLITPAPRVGVKKAVSGTTGPGQRSNEHVVQFGAGSRSCCCTLLLFRCAFGALGGHQEVTLPGLIRLRPILLDGAQAGARCTQYGWHWRNLC